jgi:hypothetical protein
VHAAWVCWSAFCQRLTGWAVAFVSKLRIVFTARQQPYCVLLVLSGWGKTWLVAEFYLFIFVLILFLYLISIMINLSNERA